MLEVTVFALQAELRTSNKSSRFTYLPLKEDLKIYICILFVLVSWLKILNAYLKRPQNCNQMKDHYYLVCHYFCLQLHVLLSKNPVCFTTLYRD